MRHLREIGVITLILLGISIVGLSIFKSGEIKPSTDLLHDPTAVEAFFLAILGLSILMHVGSLFQFDLLKERIEKLERKNAALACANKTVLPPVQKFVEPADEEPISSSSVVEADAQDP